MDEVGKPRISLTREGLATIRTQFAFASRAELLRSYPRALEGLGFDGFDGEPFVGSDGRWMASMIFRGVAEEPSEELDSFDLIGEEREAPIEEFPDRALLRREYGAYEEDGALRFPERLRRHDVLGSPLTLDTMKGGQGEVENPLFNCRSYPVEYQVARWRFVRLRVPQAVAAMVGTVLTRLPKGFEGMGAKEGARWYVRPLIVRKRGNAVEVEVQFKEISKFQATEALHNLLKRKEKGRGVEGASGL